VIDQHPALREAIVAFLLEKSHTSLKNLHRFLIARFAGSDIPVPSESATGRWAKAWKQTHGELLMAHSNPDAWKNKYMTAAGSNTAQIERINQRWELDSSPADVMLSDGRHAVLACIDIYTRRAKVLVAKTSKAAAIALLLRRCLLDWGVPETIKTDNGQDYVAQHIQRVCGMLGVKQECSAPFSPWEKGHIERFFRTFSHGIFELLPGFIGHNVTEREAIRSRSEFSDRLFKKDQAVEIRMTAEQLQAFCDDWTENLYHRESHAGIGTTPFLRAQASREAVATVSDTRILDLLLAEAPSNNGLRTVNKDGIRLDGEIYDAPELEAYRRQTVQVLFDPDDLGRIYVYAHDRPNDALESQPLKAGFHFVCVAECAARMGFTRDEVAARASEIKNRQKARVQNEKRKLKALARKVKTDTVLDEILAHKRASAAQVVQFPKAKFDHQSDGIAAARDALAQADAAVQADPIRFGLAPTPEQVFDILDDLKTRPTQLRPMFESPTERAMWLFEHGMAGREAELFTGEDRIFLQDFRKNWPGPYRTVNDILSMKYEGKWEQYNAFRRAVGWPEATKPRD
jgi:transposase InsO family protein